MEGDADGTLAGVDVVVGISDCTLVLVEVGVLLLSDDTIVGRWVGDSDAVDTVGFLDCKNPLEMIATGTTVGVVNTNVVGFNTGCWLPGFEAS